MFFFLFFFGSVFILLSICLCWPVYPYPVLVSLSLCSVESFNILVSVSVLTNTQTMTPDSPFSFRSKFIVTYESSIHLFSLIRVRCTVSLSVLVASSFFLSVYVSLLIC